MPIHFFRISLGPFVVGKIILFVARCSLVSTLPRGLSPIPNGIVKSIARRKFVFVGALLKVTEPDVVFLIST